MSPQRSGQGAGGAPHHEIVDREHRVALTRREELLLTADGEPLVATVKRPAGAEGPLPAALLVHGLGQNRFSWHLSRRSFENHLVAHGFETWNLELRGHGRSREAGSRHPATVEEYVEYDVPAAVSRILADDDQRPLFYVGHSLGAMIGYQLDDETLAELAGMVSIAGPFHFARGNWRLRTAARLLRPGLDASAVRIWPRLPFLVGMFGRGFGRALWNLDTRLSLFPLHIWYPGSIERDLLRERIGDGWDRTGLGVLRHMMRWAETDGQRSADEAVDHLARLDRLQLPLLCVVGEEDDPVPPASVAEGFERVGSNDKHWRSFGQASHGVPFGHLDLVCGRHAAELVWPEIAEWMVQRASR